MNAEQLKEEIRNLNRIDKTEAAADLLSRIGAPRNRPEGRELIKVCGWQPIETV
jgi:hypothetical protein